MVSAQYYVDAHALHLQLRDPGTLLLPLFAVIEHI